MLWLSRLEVARKHGAGPLLDSRGAFILFCPDRRHGSRCGGQIDRSVRPQLIIGPLRRVFRDRALAFFRDNWVGGREREREREREKEREREGGRNRE